MHIVHGRTGRKLVPVLLAPQCNSRSVHADILPSAESFEVPASKKEGLMMFVFIYLILRFSCFIFGIQKKKMPYPQPYIAEVSGQLVSDSQSLKCRVAVCEH